MESYIKKSHSGTEEKDFYFDVEKKKKSKDPYDNFEFEELKLSTNLDHIKTELKKNLQKILNVIVSKKELNT